jgi:hypothetical protein
LGQHRTGGVVHTGQQGGPGGRWRWHLGAAQGLAVDRDDPPPTTCGVARALAA